MPPPTAVGPAHDLARRVRSWHAAQGDSLSAARCQRVVAALYGHPDWDAFRTAVAADPDRADADRCEAERLKTFGYSPDAAAALVAHVTQPAR